MATAMLGNGIYSLGEAARLTGLRPQRVREWFRGRISTAAPTVFPGDYRPVAGHPAISFQLDYDEATRLARRRAIAPLVVLDPAVGFGKPVAEKFGVSTRVLAAAFEANGRDAATVAAMFGVDEPHVRAAVAFEARLAA